MILVTGATGFIGRRVVAALASAGHPVRALVHTPSRAAVLSHLDAETAVGDVLDSGSLSRACEGVDTVVHLVAAIRESGRLTFQRVNFEGTRNLLQAASEARVKRVIYASTIGASSDPAIPYMNSRWMAEQETVNSDIPCTIMRFSVIFGEGDEFFNVLAAQVKLFPLVPVVGSGKTRFQPIAADDVARCIVDACQKEDTVGRTLEVGGPTYITYDGMLDLVAETLGARIAKVHVPLPLVRPVVAIMQALVPRPPVTTEQLKMLRLDNVADLDSVEKSFGFLPQPMRGNLDYLKMVGLGDAIRMNLGFMPARIRDH